MLRICQGKLHVFSYFCQTQRKPHSKSCSVWKKWCYMWINTSGDSKKELSYLTTFENIFSIKIYIFKYWSDLISICFFFPNPFKFCFYLPQNKCYFNFKVNNDPVSETGSRISRNRNKYKYLFSCYFRIINVLYLMNEFYMVVKYIFYWK